ncbi:glycosyltransferase [Hungatella hathewayi]|uniref:glycosyltransferase n=1 Tax=Hungatella hathewayi TaxID=154046 RepID=UPI003565BAE7
MKITVVIPCFNVQSYIGECIESVEKQTFTEIEVICINDGSTDNTGDILKQYSEKYRNVKVLAQQNRGVAYSRNLGIQEALGEYIFFLDADDYLISENALISLYQGIMKYGTDLCGGKIIFDQYDGFYFGDDREKRFFDREGKYYYSDYQFDLGFTRYLYRTSFLRENQVYFADLRNREDPPFLVKAMVNASEFATVTENIYFYRSVEKERNEFNKMTRSDILKGFLLELKIAGMHGLERLHKDCIKNFNALWGLYYQDVIQENQEILEGLAAIKETLRPEWILPDNPEDVELRVFQEKENYSDYLQKRNSFIDSVRSAKRVIVYGAGIVGRSTIAYLSSIVGNEKLKAAVTCIAGNRNEINGIPVREITEYVSEKNIALVVVATECRYHKEISDFLDTLGFMNRCYLSYDLINVWSEMKISDK